jgi:hypothetical protein
MLEAQLATMASLAQPQDVLCARCNGILAKSPASIDDLLSMESFHHHHDTLGGLVEAAANGCPICVATVRELRA